MDHGDVLVLYTDGITEAINFDYEEYGENRLIETVSKYYHLEAEILRNQIFDNVINFTDGFEQYDDITLVVLKVK